MKTSKKELSSEGKIQALNDTLERQVKPQPKSSMGLKNAEKIDPVLELKSPKQNNVKDKRKTKQTYKPPLYNQQRDPKTLRLPKIAPDACLLKNMTMPKSVYAKIKNSIGKQRAETGGMLLGDVTNYHIVDFVFDEQSDNTGVSYQPNTQFLNAVLDQHASEFIGIVHSHPKGVTSLSMQDLRAAWSNMTAPGNPLLTAYLMPLIQTSPDTGKFELIPYIVTCHPEGNGKVIVHTPKLILIEG